MSTTLAPPEPITGTCDRCIAAATVRATLANGDLLLCGHHYRHHATALKNAALKVEGDTQEFGARPDPAAERFEQCRAEAVRRMTAKHGGQDFPDEAVASLAMYLYASGWPAA